MTRIAVIPARGGSKRIPRKNVKSFCGMPMISWPIKIAISSRLFDRVVVSTDDKEIAEIARTYGAEVPFIRPNELATDTTATVPVIQHAITALAAQQDDIICCIYPTAAFIQADDLQKSMQELMSDTVDFVMPVTAYSCPLSRALKLSEDGLLNMCSPEFVNSRTQDCAVFYYDVGQFYLGKTSAWCSERSFYQQRVKAVVVPKYRAHDIDTQEDWDYAEMLFSSLIQANRSELYSDG